jgi:hypothetical protein
VICASVAPAVPHYFRAPDSDVQGGDAQGERSALDAKPWTAFPNPRTDSQP